MPSKTPSIVLGAAVYAVLSIVILLVNQRLGASAQVAVGSLSCLLMLAGPLVAVWHYTSTHRLTILPGEGAGLGALSLAIGALVAGIIGQVMVMVNLAPDPTEAMAMQRQKMIADGMDPAQFDQMMNSGLMDGMISNPIVGILVGVVFGAAAGAIAGAIGALVFKKGPAEPGAIERRRA